MTVPDASAVGVVWDREGHKVGFFDSWARGAQVDPPHRRDGRDVQRVRRAEGADLEDPDWRMLMLSGRRLASGVDLGCQPTDQYAGRVAAACGALADGAGELVGLEAAGG